MKTSSIPIGIFSEWDGSSKQYTKDCDKCESYKKIKDKELCVWGIAIKYLERTSRLRKCRLINIENKYSCGKNLFNIIN
jgi:hypothetical protein